MASSFNFASAERSPAAASFTLSPVYSNGINNGPAHSGQWVSASDVLYPCGQHFCVHNVDTGAQRFMTTDVASATTSRSPFAVHPLKTHVAVTGVSRRPGVVEVCVVDLSEWGRLCAQARAHSIPPESSEATLVDEPVVDGSAAVTCADGVGVWTGIGSPGVALRSAALRHGIVASLDVAAALARGSMAPLSALSPLVTVAFSADGRWLLLQVGAPSWALLRWDWHGSVQAAAAAAADVPPRGKTPTTPKAAALLASIAGLRLPVSASPSGTMDAAFHPHSRAVVSTLAAADYTVTDSTSIDVAVYHPLAKVADEFCCMALGPHQLGLVGSTAGRIYVLRHLVLVQVRARHTSTHTKHDAHTTHTRHTHTRTTASTHSPIHPLHLTPHGKTSKHFAARSHVSSVVS